MEQGGPRPAPAERATWALPPPTADSCPRPIRKAPAWRLF